MKITLNEDEIKILQKIINQWTIERNAAHFRDYIFIFDLNSGRVLDMTRSEEGTLFDENEIVPLEIVENNEDNFKLYRGSIYKKDDNFLYIKHRTYKNNY